MQIGTQFGDVQFDRSGGGIPSWRGGSGGFSAGRGGVNKSKSNAASLTRRVNAANKDTKGFKPFTTGSLVNWINTGEYVGYGSDSGNPGNPGGYSPYGNSGGGGQSTADKSKPYLNYYKRILGISPNKGLVAKAVKGDYTMQEFQLLVQRQDTNRFLKTAQGQEVVAPFQTLWARIFPSLGHQAGIKALRGFLKQKSTSNYRRPTNPTDIRGMYAFLSQTKEFKRIYGDFAGTQFERTLDFSGYRQYKDEFRNIMRQYTDKFATDDEISYFFNSRIAPTEFEKNMQVVLGGKDAYAWKGGEQLDQQVAKKAMYGRKGGMQTLQKIAGALEAQKGYMGARQATFDIRQNEQGRIEQSGLYGNN